MKAEIDESGKLTVTACNALESFALQQWANQYFSEAEKKDGSITLEIVATGRNESNDDT